MIIFILPYFLSVGCHKAGMEKRTPAEKDRPAYINETTEKWMPFVWKDFVKNGPTGICLPDFSRAGYGMGEKPIPKIENPVFDVTDVRFGAVPDDGKEDVITSYSIHYTKLYERALRQSRNRKPSLPENQQKPVRPSHG